jgi:hypothetical protein
LGFEKGRGNVAAKRNDGMKRDVARAGLIFQAAWRREYLERIFLWNALDLERKLRAYSLYYNSSRVHQSLSGNTPDEKSGIRRPACARLHSYGWQQLCRGLIHTPVAA